MDYKMIQLLTIDIRGKVVFMARPEKEGLDYFSLDVKMNDEAELIEAQYGLEGFAILIKMYQKIYSEGYFLLWDEKQQILFSNKVSSDRSTVTSIIDDCVRWGIFDKELYAKYQILTSKRIQKHYVSAVYKRNRVEMMSDYLLIIINDRSNIEVIGVSDIRNTETTIVSDSNKQGTTIVSDDKSTQSKVKKSKVKKSKEKDTATETVQVPFEEVKNLYLTICKSYPKIKLLSANRKKTISARWKDYKSIDAFKELFTKAEDSQFLKGENERQWKADFDWLLKDSSMAKVLEGKYDNKGGGDNGPVNGQNRKVYEYDKSKWGIQGERGPIDDDDLV